jgi:mRNA interferase YafQ
MAGPRGPEGGARLTRPIRTTRQFERDLKTARRRGKNLNKIWAVVDLLVSGQRLPARYRAHKLAGEWADFWECHVEPDWLLIWRDEVNALVLVRAGSHADLFD